MGVLEEFEQKQKELAETEPKRARGGRPDRHPVVTMEIGSVHYVPKVRNNRMRMENSLNGQRRKGKRFHVETTEDWVRIERLEDAPVAKDIEEERERKWQKKWQSQLTHPWHEFSVGEEQKIFIPNKKKGLRMFESLKRFIIATGWEFEREIVRDEETPNWEFMIVKRVS